MDFHLTKEQLLVRKMYREFAENEVKPLAAEIDEEERFPIFSRFFIARSRKEVMAETLV